MDKSLRVPKTLFRIFQFGYNERYCSTCHSISIQSWPITAYKIQIHIVQRWSFQSFSSTEINHAGFCNTENFFAAILMHYTAFRSNCRKKKMYNSKTIVVISFFFFPLIDNLIKFCFKQRMSHQLKNLSLLLTINLYCMFHIEGFFPQQLFLYFIS